MEKVTVPEHIPSEEQLTEFVGNFANRVYELMRIRGVPVEGGSDDGTTKIHKQVITEGGTIIVLSVNNRYLTDKGTAYVRVIVKCPDGKHLNIEGLENSQFYEFGIANHKGDMRSNLTHQRLHGYQFLVKNRAGRSLGDFFNGSTDYDKDYGNTTRLKILRALHKLVVDEMYQPYLKPVRDWLQESGI